MRGVHGVDSAQDFWSCGAAREVRQGINVADATRRLGRACCDPAPGQKPRSCRLACWLAASPSPSVATAAGGRALKGARSADLGGCAVELGEAGGRADPGDLLGTRGRHRWLVSGDPVWRVVAGAGHGPPRPPRPPRQPPTPRRRPLPFRENHGHPPAPGGAPPPPPPPPPPPAAR